MFWSHWLSISAILEIKPIGSRGWFRSLRTVETVNKSNIVRVVLVSGNHSSPTLFTYKRIIGWVYWARSIRWVDELPHLRLCCWATKFSYVHSGRPIDRSGERWSRLWRCPRWVPALNVDTSLSPTQLIRLNAFQWIRNLVCICIRVQIASLLVGRYVIVGPARRPTGRLCCPIALIWHCIIHGFISSKRRSRWRRVYVWRSRFILNISHLAQMDSECPILLVCLCKFPSLEFGTSHTYNFLLLRRVYVFFYLF